MADSLVARVDATGGGRALWYTTDRLGSVLAITNAQGLAIKRLSFDAFQNATHMSAASLNDRYSASGREDDLTVRLRYEQTRWYDPTLGRWISEDPKGLEGGDFNLYRYGYNNQHAGKQPTSFFGEVVAGAFDFVGGVFWTR
jgi:RHS repeat-associated protein